MKRNGIAKGRAMSIPGGARLGAVYSILWTLTASSLLSWLIHTQKLEEQAIGYGSMVILLSASIVGAVISYRKVKRLRVAACFSAGGIYYLILLGITAIFFGGQYTGMGVTALLVLGGSATAIFMSMEHSRGKGRKIRI